MPQSMRADARAIGRRYWSLATENDTSSEGLCLGFACDGAALSSCTVLYCNSHRKLALSCTAFVREGKKRDCIFSFHSQKSASSFYRGPRLQISAWTKVDIIIQLVTAIRTQSSSPPSGNPRRLLINRKRLHHRFVRNSKRNQGHPHRTMINWGGWPTCHPECLSSTLPKDKRWRNPKTAAQV